MSEQVHLTLDSHVMPGTDSLSSPIVLDSGEARTQGAALECLKRCMSVTRGRGEQRAMAIQLSQVTIEAWQTKQWQRCNQQRHRCWGHEEGLDVLACAHEHC